MYLQSLITTAVLLLLALGLARGQEDAEAAAEKVQPSGIYFQYAIFFAPEPEGDPLKQANAVFHKDFELQFTYRADVVKFVQGNYVEFGPGDRTDYAPPGEEFLKHKGFGLTETERKAVPKSTEVLMLAFFIVEPQDYGYLTAANELAAAIAQATGGFIWDEETRELYSVDAWRRKRLSEAADPPVFSNTSMHGYELPSHNYRSVTFGMRKLGLPDLVMAEFPKAFWEPVSRMMRFLVFNVGIEGPLKPKTEWTPDELQRLLGLAPDTDIPKLALTKAPRENGDPQNDLFTVDFSIYPGESYQEKQLYVIGRLFEPESGLLDVWRGREQLLALSEEARKTLKGKKPLFEQGLPEKEQLLVKVFTGEEYLWLAVEGWEGDTLEGVRVPDVTPDGRLEPADGKKRQVTVDQVFDYLHIRADGSEEGNETGKFIRKIQASEAKNSEPSAKGSGPLE